MKVRITLLLANKHSLDSTSGHDVHQLFVKGNSIFNFRLHRGLTDPHASSRVHHFTCFSSQCLLPFRRNPNQSSKSSPSHPKSIPWWCYFITDAKMQEHCRCTPVQRVQVHKACTEITMVTIKAAKHTATNISTVLKHCSMYIYFFQKMMS